MMSTEATQRSAERLAAVVPMLTAAGRFALMAGAALPRRTLFHAGPPFEDLRNISAPILNAAAVVAVVEGWAVDTAQARGAIEAGDIRLAPAQDHGLVVPLAFVAGPSTGVLRVADGAGQGSALAAINDGPPDGALRFGAPNDQAMDRVRKLGDLVAPALDRVLREAPIPLALIAVEALKQGDELHGQVAASSAAMLKILEHRLANDPAWPDIAAANQFFLNVWMAACALMLKAGAGIPDSRLICAAGGNGQTLGLKLAGEFDRWVTQPAATPLGPRLSPALADVPALPAVGDSAVIDACGFGAQALGFAPALRAAFGDAVPPGVLEAPANLLCAESQIFGDLHIRVGLDIDRIGRSPFCANLAMVDRDGVHGLVGRGIALLIGG